MKLVSIGIIGLFLSFNTFAENKVSTNEYNQKTSHQSELSVVDQYNAKRQAFLIRKQQILQQHRQKLSVEKEESNKKLAVLLHKQALKDELRRKHGLPISRFENKGGASGMEAGISREMMSAVSSGAPLPKIPPTGKIQEVK